MWNRRRAATVIASSMVVAGCAVREPRKGPPILVNLANQAPGPADTAELSSSADAAKRVTAPVMINDQGPFDFVVDTGANRTVISTELAAALSLPSAGRAQINGIAGVESSGTALINKLDVGRVTSRRLRAPTLQRARLGADGLMGVDVLKNRRVAIDFRRNVLTVSKADDGETRVQQNVADGRLRDARADLAAESNVVIVPARYRFGQLIIIDADLGGVPVTAFLDSGSQNTVGNLRLQSQLRSALGLSTQVSVVELISATGQRARGEFSSVPSLRMGGLSIGNLSAVFADLHIFKLWELNDRPALLVGIDVMRHFEAIELDFANRRVLFRTPARTLRRPG
ncbi:retroviral-like aspartic protease family protein [Phenylobacterium sp.]|uniref:retroviral-like aspartic protease family protein n=1 Tax=Phenylobacterium sp. TaxID=1871053 RepID=UPI00286D4026|nr:retroviral-like aspartic protease family protein [Phenylobacterium sp.]